MKYAVTAAEMKSYDNDTIKRIGITADVLMPLGGLLTCLFAGWYLDKKIFRKEISNDGTLRAPLFGVLVFLLKWVAPMLIGTTFIYNLAF